MNFDPMAAAIDWLDAYRANDVDAILAMYADDTCVECERQGTKTVPARSEMRAYWERRFKDDPAPDLEDLQPCLEGASVSFLTKAGAVRVILHFNADGQIASLKYCAST